MGSVVLKICSSFPRPDGIDSKLFSSKQAVFNNIQWYNEKIRVIFKVGTRGEIIGEGES
jgi:hypothetical protein